MNSKLVLYLRAQAFRRGVLGSNRHWFAVWAGLGLAAFLHKRLSPHPVVVERIVLREGQTLEIRDTGIPRETFRAIER